MGIAVLYAIVKNCDSSSDMAYEINHMKESTIIYPNVNYVKPRNHTKTNSVNNIILDNLYGPYGFLKNDDVSSDLNYEIAFMSEKYLSICYKGGYTLEDGTCKDICYGVNIDLEQECIIPIQCILREVSMEDLYDQIKQKNFVIEYGIITPEEENRIKMDDVLPYQTMFKEKSDFYHYYFNEDNLFIIITGLPLYGGSYSVIKLPKSFNNS